MTQQWQLSGNAESVDWSDLAMAGRAYADNLVGEPAVSKIMHMMADEIERLRTVIRPESYARSDEKCVLYDTKRGTTQPRNGALSGCETVPDPDSRVWETPRTPQPHPPPPQGSVQGEGSFRDSRNAKEPVAWAVETGGELEASFCGPAGREDAADWREQSDGVIVPLYRSPTLTAEEREAVKWCRDNITAIAHPSSAFAYIHAATLRSLLERLGGSNG